MYKAIKSILFITLTTFVVYGFTQKENDIERKTPIKKITFYELGSVRCIPCKKMQPVMKAIEEKYQQDVEVVFYDVWTKEGKELAKKFTFQAIPTQIFVDKKGVEFFRHEGYFPEKEISKVLDKQLKK